MFDMQREESVLGNFQKGLDSILKVDQEYQLGKGRKDILGKREGMSRSIQKEKGRMCLQGMGLRSLEIIW